MNKLKLPKFVKKIIWILTTILIISCNKPPQEVVSLQEAMYTCDAYIPEKTQYQADAIIYLEINPIIYINYETDKPDINLKKIEGMINEKFSQCNLTFKIENPLYVNIQTNNLSYRTNLNRDFKLGQLRMAIYPEGVRFDEETVGIIQGAANGIPTMENPSTGKPIFFIRGEKMYTDVVAHELGHVFSLYHTFTSGGNSCDTGDKIPSTITPPNDLSIVVETCKPISGSLKHYTKEEIENFVTNPMSYSPDECMKDFTLDQCQRMRKAIEVNLALQSAIYKIEYEGI